MAIYEVCKEYDYGPYEKAAMVVLDNAGNRVRVWIDYSTLKSLRDAAKQEGK